MAGWPPAPLTCKGATSARPLRVDVTSTLTLTRLNWNGAEEAFQQVEDTSEAKSQRLEGMNEMNIWYGKYYGEHWSGGALDSREAAATRCKLTRDAGYTRADKTNAKEATDLRKLRWDISEDFDRV